jgi:hypothetical protein
MCVDSCMQARLKIGCYKWCQYRVSDAVLHMVVFALLCISGLIWYESM